MITKYSNKTIKKSTIFSRPAEKKESLKYQYNNLEQKSPQKKHTGPCTWFQHLPAAPLTRWLSPDQPQNPLPQCQLPADDNINECDAVAKWWTPNREMEENIIHKEKYCGGFFVGIGKTLEILQIIWQTTTCCYYLLSTCCSVIWGQNNGGGGEMVFLESHRNYEFLYPNFSLTNFTGGHPFRLWKWNSTKPRFLICLHHINVLHRGTPPSKKKIITVKLPMTQNRNTAPGREKIRSTSEQVYLYYREV